MKIIRISLVQKPTYFRKPPLFSVVTIFKTQSECYSNDEYFFSVNPIENCGLLSDSEIMPFYGSIVVIKRSGADGSTFPLINEVRSS